MEAGPPGQGNWGSPALGASRKFWVNAVMQMRKSKLRLWARRAAEGVAAAPLMAALALASTVITAVVALDTVGRGRVPADGSIGLVCALVLAAVAAVEASRPVRVERTTRRIARPPSTRQDASDLDVPTTSRWR